MSHHDVIPASSITTDPALASFIDDLQTQIESYELAAEEMVVFQEHALEMQAIYKSELEHIPLPLFMLNIDGSIRDVNQAALLLGGADSKLNFINNRFSTYVCHDKLPIWSGFWHKMVQETASDNTLKSDILGIKVDDKCRFPFSAVAKRINANPLGVDILLLLIPIQESDNELFKLSLYQRLFTEMREGVIITDRNANIIDINTAFTDITDYRKVDVIGQNARIMSSGQHDVTFYQNMWHHLLKRGFWQGEIWNKRRNGQIYPEWLSITALKDKHGRTEKFIGIFSDISERKDAEGKIKQLAYFDNLTTLANRAHFLTILYEAIKQHQQQGDAILGLIYVDLDGFKRINDLYGHAAGDTVLKTSAQRMLLELRDVDLVARLGGDEFAVLVKSAQHEEDLYAIAERILEGIKKPISLNGRQEKVGASIGIVVYPDDASDADTLVMRGDAAMYVAKTQGKGRINRWQNIMEMQLQRKQRLEKSLKDAMDHNRSELFIMLQPQVDITTAQSMGFEALIRWQLDDELIMPNEFIPVAERMGIISDIGRCVIACVVNIWLSWRQESLTLLPISINLTAQDIQNTQIVSHIIDILSEHNIPNHLLCVEITESVAVENFDLANQVIQHLTQAGIRVALDDFGTGFSSLQYLKQLPLSSIKIDKIFIDPLPSDSIKDQQMLESIIAIAQAMQLGIVVEGVETQEQLLTISHHKDILIQGYLTGKPLSAKDAGQKIRQQMLY